MTARGIEPLSSGLESAILPLNYAVLAYGRMNRVIHPNLGSFFVAASGPTIGFCAFSHANGEYQSSVARAGPLL